MLACCKLNSADDWKNDSITRTYRSLFGLNFGLIFAVTLAVTLDYLAGDNFICRLLRLFSLHKVLEQEWFFFLRSSGF